MVIHQDPYKVGKITTLGMENDVQAKKLLEDIASQVQPIMRRRKLTCPLLEEFFPRSSLLGLNTGGGGGSTARISIRLRPAKSPSSFYDYHSLLHTMLHELTHNHISLHNAAFYKLMQEMVKECEELMAKGIKGTGVGFDAPAAGVAGGMHLYKAHPEHYGDIRNAARKAAEERAKMQRIMPKEPQLLGGGGYMPVDWKSLKPAQAAAIAAERRAADNTWCGAVQADAQHAAGPSGVSSATGIPQETSSDASKEASGSNRATEGAAGPSRDPAGGPSGGVGTLAGSVRNGNSGSDGAGPSKGPIAQNRGGAGANGAGRKPPGGNFAVNGAGKKAQYSSTEVIDLCDSDEVVAVTARVQNLAAVPVRRKQYFDGKPAALPDTGWACSTCTLVNRALFLQCAACQNARPGEWQA